MATQRLYDFLKDVLYNKVSRIEIHNYLEDITKEYDPLKIKILEEDIEEFVFRFTNNSPKYRGDNSIFENLIYLQSILDSHLNKSDFDDDPSDDGEEKEDKLDSLQVKETEQFAENSSCVEKIVLLKELGVLHYLKNKNDISNNKIALIISSITKEKIGTIQPILNPIIKLD